MMQMPPRMMRHALQPMLEDTVQHAAPEATVEQAGRSVAQRYLGTVAYAMPQATTTPMGCQMESSARRYRRF
jgi:hypothetical protein